MAQVVFKEDIGTGLGVVQGKLAVKIDPASNAALTASDAGLKLDLPATTKSITAVAIEGNKVKVTDSEGVEKELELPATTVDVKLQGAEITAENKLKLTLSDNSVIEADLAKFVDAPKSAEDYWTEIKALPTFGDDTKAVVKGEVVQDLAGNIKGYLVSA
jgi:hypothetical protein